FGHRKHEMVRCEDCHAGVRQSSATSDVNLPTKELCETCHSSDPIRSAGTACALCHLYHDTSKDLSLRARAQLPIPVPILLGSEAPPRSPAGAPSPASPQATAAGTVGP